MSGVQGIVPILLTPFNAGGGIDFDSLESQIDYNIAAGVHGLGVAIGSEIFKLLPEERVALLRAVVARVDGRIPVVMNTSANAATPAIALAKEAEQCGATHLMVWPPSFFALGAESVAAHYRAISEAVNLPIILQDVVQSPISPALALRIASLAPTVEAIKVETAPNVGQVADMAAQAGDKLTILGGAGGGTFIEEYLRGARGTMPFASQPISFMKVWKSLESGDFESARKCMEREILPVSRFGFQGGDLFYHVHKSILVKLGIIASAKVRAPTTELDHLTRDELEQTVATFCEFAP